MKESLRAVPRGGLGYGALRYLRPTAAPQLPQLPLISFNYLGRQDSAATRRQPAPAGWTARREPPAPAATSSDR